MSISAVPFLCEKVGEWGVQHMLPLDDNSNNSYYHSLVDTPNFNGDTPLMLAVKNGNRALIEMLFTFDLDLERPGVELWLLNTAICLKEGAEDVLSFLLKNKLSPNAYAPGCTWPLATALSEDANSKSRLAVVEMLLDYDADVNKLVEIPDPSTQSFPTSSTAMSHLKAYVTKTPSVEILVLLIKAGLDLSVWDGNYMLHPGPTSSPGDIAPCCNMIQAWVEKHPDCKTKGDNNPTFHPLTHFFFVLDTALIVAVVHENLPLVEALLECEVDPDIPALDQPSILHWLVLEAESMRQFTVLLMKLLLQHGATTGEVYPQTGRTLLHEACSRAGRTPLVRVLLKEGHMDPNCTIPDPIGGDSITPLMLAISQNDVETVELLIEQGAIVGESEKNLDPRFFSKLRVHFSSFDFSFPSSAPSSFSFTPTQTSSLSTPSPTFSSTQSTSSGATPFSFSFPANTTAEATVPSRLQTSGFSFSMPSDAGSTVEENAATVSSAFAFGGSSFSSSP